MFNPFFFFFDLKTATYFPFLDQEVLWLSVLLLISISKPKTTENTSLFSLVRFDCRITYKGHAWSVGVSRNKIKTS